VTDEEIARLRQEIAKKREDLEWAEALIDVMSLRLAKQRKEIEELKERLCEKD
jgi:predicted  nucleic acid-binding Zn-ribbon protein